MGLIHPSGPSWAYCSHNLSSVIASSSTTFGTQVASGVSSADGSAVGLISALSHDAEYLRLRFASASAGSGVDNNALMDILIDPAGGTSWSVLIPSLAVAGLTPAQTTTNPPFGPSGGYDFPVWIPAGASIGARARNAGGTLQTFSVAAYAHGGNANPASWWCGQRVTAIGVDAANSRGTSVTPGSSGSFGSWTNFGSPLDEACGAVQWAVLGEHTFSSNWTSRGYQFEFGAGGVAYGGPFDRTLSATATRGWWIPTGPVFHRFAAGTQFQARGKSSGVAIAVSVAGYAIH
jgi:hypothetical protein